MRPRLLSMVVLLGCGLFGGPVLASDQAKPACSVSVGMPVCEVSMYRLIADPRAYDGERILVTGYLVSDFSRLYLYPSAANYENFTEVESLLILPPFSISPALLKVARDGQNSVTVIGRFAAGCRDRNDVPERLGCLREVEKVAHYPRIPSREPLDMHGVTLRSEP